ncbi:MAG: hypothetical protein LAT80_15465 [Balneolaceae bacterium]|nr:hypothetical protein [Balneolaceae bacterium]
MDKGARFYKCDFQVHTPRDINWTGKKFGVKEDELVDLTNDQKNEIDLDREQFAREYLAKIRGAGLDAIAITDHHDVEFAKIIRRIANQENREIIESGERNGLITVFPGIELTLSNPACQSIIIFDANFEDQHLDAVIHLLGITPSNLYLENTAQTLPISQTHVANLNSLHSKLDELTYCRGRYIVLPNLNDGGQHTLLRRGFHESYRKMPCVGGYVDKEISRETGYQNKISGGDVNYGNKAVALISTSDNRFEDGRELGNYSTWVKWAEPTAEALRQACLAKESRISQEDPILPQTYIDYIDVSGSKFLGSFRLSFNQQYNALIGGRGTGKSTILEYLRWALCDQTKEYYDKDELTNIEKRRTELIENTLTAAEGSVRVGVMKNRVKHVVKRDSISKEISLKIGEGDFKSVKEEDIRKLLPVQSYSQKQLSDVGVKTEELKRFIEQPIKDELERIEYEIKLQNSKIKSSYSNYIKKREAQLEIENFKLESQSLERQITAIRESLTGVSEEDQKVIDKKSQYEIEESVITSNNSELLSFEERVDELIKSLSLYPDPLPGNIEDLENSELVKEIYAEITKKFDSIKDLAKQIKNEFSENELSELNALINQWTTKKEAFSVKYEEAKARSKSSQAQLKEIRKIEERINEVNKLIAGRNKLVKEIGEPEVGFQEAKNTWKKLHGRKIQLLNEEADKFYELSKELISAEVTKSIDLVDFKSTLKSIFEGTRIREDRIDALITQITQSESPLDEFIDIINEFRSLAETRVSEDKSPNVPDTPKLTESGFNEDHRRKLCLQVTTDDWLKISAVELGFTPEFYYITNDEIGDKIKFSAASAGQQATSLLTVLLNQDGIPLMIDQPEDDIDNRAIDQIVQNIWGAKKKRQLIFTSHNANLVVNGDAELVVCCDYKDAHSQTRGEIKEEGSIDKTEVKDEITSVMEGGEKAFKLRKDKYGF